MNITPFTPKPGSFLERPGVHFVVAPGDKPMVIGRVSRVAKNRFMWARYKKPVATTTTMKTEPAFAEKHYVPRLNTAIWAIRLGHSNATKDATQ
ncbi:hypothetical protein LZK73_21970 [Neorhizobium galegae]|nr:hypothetical protein LZK73_21970 [Neorhizobium galegae]